MLSKPLSTEPAASSAPKSTGFSSEVTVPLCEKEFYPSFLWEMAQISIADPATSAPPQPTVQLLAPRANSGLLPAITRTGFAWGERELHPAFGAFVLSSVRFCLVMLHPYRRFRLVTRKRRNHFTQKEKVVE